MDSFLIISEQLISFFLMMLAGYLAARIGIVSKEVLDGLASLVVNLLLPVMIFANMMSGTSREQFVSDFPVFLLTLLMYLLLILVFALFARLMRLPKERGQIFQAVFICGNVGFIGTPLILRLSPEHGAVYLALMNVVDQAALWTYGLYLTTPTGGGRSFSVKNFVNPGLASILLAVLLIVLGIRLPDSIENGLLTLGNSATSVSLIYIGGLLYFSNWKGALRQKELYVGIMTKMLLLPVVYYALASLLVRNRDMVQVMSVVTGLPPATSIAMLAQAHHKEGEYALGMILVATVASLLTLSLTAFFIF